METPGNSLHAPYTYKPDAGGKPWSKFTPSNFSLLATPTPCPWALSLWPTQSHTYTHPKSPTLLPCLSPCSPTQTLLLLKVMAGMTATWLFKVHSHLWFYHFIKHSSLEFQTTRQVKNYWLTDSQMKLKIGRVMFENWQLKNELITALSKDQGCVSSVQYVSDNTAVWGMMRREQSWW